MRWEFSGYFASSPLKKTLDPILVLTLAHFLLRTLDGSQCQRSASIANRSLAVFLKDLDKQDPASKANRNKVYNYFSNK
jgi:hypothetical protein